MEGITPGRHEERKARGLCGPESEFGSRTETIKHTYRIKAGNNCTRGGLLRQ